MIYYISQLLTYLPKLLQSYGIKVGYAVPNASGGGAGSSSQGGGCCG
jgi:hypothetical protein